MRLFPVLFCAFLITACAATPVKQPVKKSVPDTAQAWWRDLDDPLLNQLAETISDKNLDVSMAEQRLMEARGLRRATQSDLFPEFDVTGAATRGKRDRNAPTGTTTTLEAGFDASWELDLFGSTRAAIRGAKAAEHFAAADIENVKQTIIADLARAITEWRLAVEQRATVEKLLKAQQDQIDIFKAREKAGLSDATLTTRARAQAAQSAVQLPLFTAAEKRAQFQIERLMGLEPNIMTPFLNEQKAAVKLPPDPRHIFNTDAALIKQRPDIRKAAAQIDSSNADVDVAVAALFPSINLNSFFGAQDVGHALSGNPVWNVGATLTTPIFRFGKLRAAIKVAKSRQKQALLNYDNVTLTALQEIQTALSDYLNGLDATRRQHTALIRRMDTTTLAQTRFSRGITNMTDLTTAQAEQEEAALNVVRQKADTVVAYIRLQKALGMPALSGRDARQAKPDARDDDRAMSHATETPLRPQSQD